jgi:nucleoside-diphosphate-sugar epimerase
VNQATDKRVLVTGSSGSVGRHVCRALKNAGYRVVGFDRAPMPDGFEIDDMRIGSLTDSAMLNDAAQGARALVHLAAAPTVTDYATDLMPNNIVGVYNVCEAARLAGVARLVLTSTVQVIWGHDWQHRVVTLDDEPRPDNHYALTKLHAERMGEMYARMHGLSVVSMRLGWLPRPGQQTQQDGDNEPYQSIYMSTNDAGEAYRCAVASSQPAAGESAVVMISSKPKRNIGMDLTPAKRIIGFEPRDTYPQGMPDHVSELK